MFPDALANMTEALKAAEQSLEAARRLLAVWQLPRPSVLAGRPDGDGSEGQALVVFRDWDVVRELYGLVKAQASSAAGIRQSGRFRVLAASVEVDSPDVEVWRVEDAGQLSESMTLGIGLLLSDREVAAVRRGEQLSDVSLQVQDDGILLVKWSRSDAADEGWTEIDLTGLAAEAD